MSPPTASSTVVEVEDLTRRYGSLVAVDGVGFTVRRGEMFGLIGPDGAEVYRRNGEVRTVEELMLIGEYVADQAYVDTPFEAFAARRRGTDGPEETRP